MHGTSTLSARSCLIIFFILSAVFDFPNMDIIRVFSAKESLCMDIEREALISFKQGLKDPSGRLSSWTGVECCEWSGVECNNKSGNVIKLDLRNPFPSSPYGIAALADHNITAYFMSCLGGEISSSLLQLRYLNYLDLSLNYFDGIPIPEFLGNFENLRYLNLSSSQFSGDIPPHLRNLSSLSYLDLYTDLLNIHEMYNLRSRNINWLSGLTSLKYLNMGLVDLSNNGLEILEVVSMIPSLEELHFHSCHLQTLPRSLSPVNLTLLSALDLSNNHLKESSIPNWFSNLTSLTKLNLSNNSFNFKGSVAAEGRIPGFLGRLCRLEVLDLSQNHFSGSIHELLDTFTTFCSNISLVLLDLSYNQLTGHLPNSLGKVKNLQQLHLNRNRFLGTIPETIGNLSSLQEIDLSANNMSGEIPTTLGQLSKLTNLHIEFNKWQGIITEAHLMNLTSLRHLFVHTHTQMLLVFNVTPEWDPPFRLTSVDLAHCKVGPTLPAWLRVQTEAKFVNLRGTGIDGTIPEEWFFQLSSYIIVLNLSDNKIKSKLPQKLHYPELDVLDLRNNDFKGSLPSWSSNASSVFLQSNLFSGSIPVNIGELMPQLKFLDVSRNHLNGTVPSSICGMTNLEVLTFRSNKLSGHLPHCWDRMWKLSVVDVGNNLLSGGIPSSLSHLTSLHVLVLSNNNFDGQIPPSLKNCTNLQILDLGANHLTGELPVWIGTDAMPFWILRLRRNNFSGTIPRQWCNLWNIHILDLAENNLSGFIPSCLGNLSSLTNFIATMNNLLFSPKRYLYDEQLGVVTKGRMIKYRTGNLKYVNCIDLSKNHLTGEIPKEITKLVALEILNFSKNKLTGGIPDEIGNMRWLETRSIQEPYYRPYSTKHVISYLLKLLELII